MNTTTDKTDKALAKRLLRDEPLMVSDMARLALEAIEGLGELARGKSRGEILLLIRRVIRVGTDQVRAAEQTVSLEEAAWASVRARGDLRASSRQDLRHFVRRILRVEGAATLPLRSISTAQCRRILNEAFGRSKSSYVKGRVILHSIFAYGIRQEWCDSNPVSRIEVPSIKEKPITPLSVQEVSRLRRICETEAHQSMRFSLHLMLYCGIRPTEVKRLKPSDICWEEHQVIIRPQVSKTGGGRAVPLRGLGNLTPHDCAIPRNWERRWQQLRRAAGFTRWVPDVCRHTFASYHAAHFRNLPALQLEMGHRDCSLLRSRYMVPARRSDAAHFWQLPGIDADSNEASHAEPGCACHGVHG